MAAAALAASVLAAVGVWNLLPPADDGRDDTTAAAAQWYSQLQGHWEKISMSPAGYAVPRSVVAVPQGWQMITRAARHNGVAFDLSRPGAARAVLFVVRMSAASLPSSPPAMPQSASGGRTIAAWQNAGRVYVLVVEGDEREYRRVLKSTSGHMA